jgi:ribosomal protein L21
MPYAVIRTGGKQYRVAPGDTVRIERLTGDVGSPVEFTEVLLTSGGDGAIRIGTPLVEALGGQVGDLSTNEGRRRSRPRRAARSAVCHHVALLDLRRSAPTVTVRR